jgi:hypothetical protein
VATPEVEGREVEGAASVVDGADVTAEPVTGTEVVGLVTPGVAVLPLGVLHTGCSIGALKP